MLKRFIQTTAQTMEKRLITVEKAKSGRAKCRRCASKIEKGETRVGVKGWIAGRQAIMWQKPDCFSKGMEFAKAKSSRGKCKMTGEQFTKGEDQLVFTVHNSRIPIKLSAVGSALEEVQSITTIKMEDVEGFENLEESSVSVLKNSLSGAGSSSNTKKRPVEEDPVQEEETPTPKKKKAKKASASKKIPVTEREILKRAEVLPKGFKIVSWNVDGLRAPFRLEGLEKIAQDESPDLIVIQETKLQRMHTEEIHKKCPEGYDSWWFCSVAKKGYSGTAVFTKKGSASNVKIVGAGDGTFCPAMKSGNGTISSYFGTKSKSKSSSSNRIVSIRFGTGESQADAEGRSITVEYESFYVVNLYVVYHFYHSRSHSCHIIFSC